MRGILFALLLVGPVAHAEDLEKARAYFQAGVDAYDSGKYEVALREFQQSHALSHNPALYFNMAACEEKMNHYQAAALLLRQYLIENPTADDKDKVEARIKVLEERDNDMKRPEPPVEKPPVAKVEQPPPPQPPPPPPPKKRVISWALLGVTAALAVGWIGAGSYALVRHNDLQSSCSPQLLAERRRRAQERATGLRRADGRDHRGGGGDGGHVHRRAATASPTSRSRATTAPPRSCRC